MSSATLKRTWRLKVSCVCEGHLRNQPWFIMIEATCDPQSSLEHVVVCPGIFVVKVQQRIIFKESRAPAAGISLHTNSLSTLGRSHSASQHAAAATHSHSQAQTGPGDRREDAWDEAASPDNTQWQRPQLLNPAGSTAIAWRKTTAARAKDSACSLSQFLQCWCEVTGTSPGNA